MNPSHLANPASRVKKLSPVWICLTVALLWAPLPPEAQDSRPPNIIFILADDLGWSELGCYGNTFHETPHLDQLAQEGIRFTRAYAAAPVCSPYRASLLTGQYPARHGILDYLRPQGGALPESHETFPERLRDAGYATGYIGKWHLTGYQYHGAEKESRPTAHGFDEEHFSEIKGVGNGANTYPYIFREQPIPWLNSKDKALPGNEYLTDRLYHEALNYIDRNADRPFYLQLSHYAPHSILDGKPALVRKYLKKHLPAPSTRPRCYLCQDIGATGDPGHHWAPDYNPHLAAMVESIDAGIGQIRERLAKLGLAEQTVIVFTSDNGGERNVTQNGPLRGGKSQLFEGGIRVPLIVSWPGNFPTAQTCSVPTSNVDFYPTLVSLGHASRDPRQFLDGRSLAPWLRDPGLPPTDRLLYWHYPIEKPHFLGGVSASAILQQSWKLITFHDSDQVQLFDLATDPGESRDLSQSRPDLTHQLREQLTAWRQNLQ